MSMVYLRKIIEKQKKKTVLPKVVILACNPALKRTRQEKRHYEEIKRFTVKSVVKKKSVLIYLSICICT